MLRGGLTAPRVPVWGTAPRSPCRARRGSPLTPWSAPGTVKNVVTMPACCAASASRCAPGPNVAVVLAHGEDGRRVGVRRLRRHDVGGLHGVVRRLVAVEDGAEDLVVLLRARVLDGGDGQDVAEHLGVLRAEVRRAAAAVRVPGDGRELASLQHVEILLRPRHHVLHDVGLRLAQVGVEAQRILRRVAELVDDEHDRRESAVPRRVLVEHLADEARVGVAGLAHHHDHEGQPGASSTSAAGGR